MEQAISELTSLGEALGSRTDVSSALPTVLCVDDDVNILDAFRRHLRKKFQVHTAVGPMDGLQAIRQQGPFGVIVSDFQMPGMNGIEFLTKARALAPDAVRIMLTGQADFSTAIGAVNQGNIFRFLVKPCAPPVLEKVLEAGFAQHRLLIAERQLTQETLLGCVQLLVEVLSIVQPESFSRSNRVRRYIKQIAEGMGIPIPWEIEAAALLSQIGWITLAPDLLSKASSGATLSREEQVSFLQHAAAAARILERIPRLDQVAKIIEQQHVPFKDLADRPRLDGSDPIGMGTQLLKAAGDFDSLRHGGFGQDHALEQMRKTSGIYMPEVLDAIAAIERVEAQDEIRLVPLSKLQIGMILEDELRSQTGALLLGKGHEIPSSFLQRLGNCSYGLPPDHMCKVRIRPPVAPN